MLVPSARSASRCGACAAVLGVRPLAWPGGEGPQNRRAAVQAMPRELLFLPKWHKGKNTRAGGQPRGAGRMPAAPLNANWFWSRLSLQTCKECLPGYAKAENGACVAPSQ